MDTRINLDLLDRQLAGGEDANPELVEVARMTAGFPKVNIDARWERLNQPVTTKRINVHHIWRYVSIAAGIIVTIIGIKYISNQSTPSSKTYTTAPGHISKITLASGAQVTLAPSTKLSVTGNDVTLDGQAVFTVLHNKRIPFSVKTAGATIRVLGTTFGVSAYNDETYIAVAEGRVAVNTTVLAVGDAAKVSDQNINVRHSADIASALAWTEGRLVFDDVPFKETITQLEHWYGITITVRDPALLSRHLVTTLTTETPAQALTLIARAMDARVEIRGSRATFTKP